MRNTQLDSSVPRRRAARGQEWLPTPDAPVAVRYLPPILVALASSVFLALLFAALAYLTFTLTLTLLTPAPGDAETPLLLTGACGLLTLFLAGVAIYFIYASIVAGRDLRGRPATFDGRIRLKHTGRGRAGGHWLVIGPDAPAAPADLAQALPDLRPSAAEEAALAREPATRGFVRGTGPSFGAQLQGVQIESRSAAEPVVPEVRGGGGAWRRLAADEINLRIDKHIYEALTAGDRIQAVYSPHLQHVYYIRKRLDGSAIVLRNTVLI